MDQNKTPARSDALPADWKWLTLFSVPAQIEQGYRTWLAEAQRAEEQALLQYWAQRSPRSEADQAA